MGEYFSLLSFLEIEILLHQTILRNSIIHNIVMADRYCKILFDTCLQQMVYFSKSELYKLRHLASQLFPIIVILRTMNYRINSSRQFYSWFRLLNFPHRWQQVIVSHVSKHDAVLDRWTIHSLYRERDPARWDFVYKQSRQDHNVRHDLARDTFKWRRIPRIFKSKNIEIIDQLSLLQISPGF